MDTEQSGTKPTAGAGAFTYPPSESFSDTVDQMSNEEVEAEIQRQAEQTPHDKILTYEERLKRNDIAKEEALKIVDSLLAGESYVEEVKLGSKASAKFTTRSTRFNSFLADRVDIADPKKVGKLSQLMSEYQLAASIVELNGESWGELKESAPEEEWVRILESKRERVKLLPSPVFVAVCNHLSRFDAKMILVFSDGYVENF